MQIAIDKVMDIVNETLKEDNLFIEQPDQSMSQLGVNSIAFIRIVVALEASLNIEVPDEFLLMSVMDSVNAIMDMLSSI